MLRSHEVVSTNEVEYGDEAFTTTTCLDFGDLAMELGELGYRQRGHRWTTDYATTKLSRRNRRPSSEDYSGLYFG